MSSSYLELLQKLEGFDSVNDITSGDSSSIITGLNELFGKKDVDYEKHFTPIDMRSARSNTYEEESFFKDQAILYYPQDLFQPGNTAYIYFQIKDSEGAQIDMFGTDQVNKSAGSDVAPLKRIALYMPPSVKVNYDTKWEDANLSIRQNIGLGAEFFKGNFTDALKQVGSRVADTVLSGAPVQTDLEFASKKILDPQAALLFKGVNFREFQFDFQMLARNVEETEVIRKIIKTFKYAMHPGTSGEGGAMWNYPYFFEIYLCSPSRKYMFNIMNCALRTMEVDYGGSGIPSFFRDNGAPVDIRMTLTFRELFVLTKKMILNDY